MPARGQSDSIHTTDRAITEQTECGECSFCAASNPRSRIACSFCGSRLPWTFEPAQRQKLEMKLHMARREKNKHTAIPATEIPATGLTPPTELAPPQPSLKALKSTEPLMMPGDAITAAIIKT